MRRYALVAGANDGGPERARLRYAAADARAVAGVLGELGGVLPEDQLVVLDPDIEGLRAALRQLQARLAAAPDSQRTEVIFYYSGHSDEAGLLLGGARLGYAELRTAIQGLDTEVRIAILDSCASGALVRGKGGRHVAGFLDDGANQVAGHAFLTSSAADEVSQEADTVGGSYFTSALVTGLRGAADANADRRVTLHEAYRFAYDETLTRTESSRYGAQHANFDMELSGSGDLVMTDLRSRTSTLWLDPALEGRLTVREPGGRVVAELGKTRGAATELRLEPGTYLVALRGPAGPQAATARIGGPATVALRPADFGPLTLAAATARGDAPPAEGGEAIADDRDQVQILVDALAGLGADGEPPRVGVVQQGADLAGFSFGIGATAYTGSVEGVQLALGANTTAGAVDGAQLALAGNLVGGSLRGVQGAVGFNAARGGLDGGLMLASGLNLGAGAEEARGALISAGANLYQGDLVGAALAAGGNLHQGSLEGAMLAAGANLQADGALRGFQGSAAFNLADELHGTQLAAVNVADVVGGAQIGVVNVSDELNGAAVGLINVARRAEGPAVGLLNFIGDGIHEAELGWSPLGVSAQVKLGSRSTYTALGVAQPPTAIGGLPGLGLGLAFGGRARPGPLELDLDLGADLVLGDAGFSGDAALQPRARAVLGWPLAPWVTPYVGLRAGAAWGVHLGAEPGPRGEARPFIGAEAGLRI